MPAPPAPAHSTRLLLRAACISVCIQYAWRMHGRCIAKPPRLPAPDLPDRNIRTPFARLPDASFPPLPARSKRKSRRGSDRLAPRHAACADDRAAGGGDLFLAAARPARPAADRGDRDRGTGLRPAHPAPHAHATTSRSMTRAGPIRRRSVRSTQPEPSPPLRRPSRAAPDQTPSLADAASRASARTRFETR